MTVKVDALISRQFLAADLEEIRLMQEEGKKHAPKTDIVWRNVGLFAALHFGAVIGLYQLFFDAKWATVAWGELFPLNMKSSSESESLQSSYSMSSGAWVSLAEPIVSGLIAPTKPPFQCASS